MYDDEIPSWWWTIAGLALLIGLLALTMGLLKLAGYLRVVFLFLPTTKHRHDFFEKRP